MQRFLQNVQRYSRSVLVGALIGSAIVVVFVAGFVFRGTLDLQRARASADSLTTDYSLLGEVQSLLNDHYLRQQPSPKEREYAAIRGVLAALSDKYTFLVDPPVAQSESDVLAGTYGGIGVQIKRSEAGDLTLYPFLNSPAAAAGVQDGDVLLAINHAPVEINQQADSVDQMLRGEVKNGNG